MIDNICHVLYRTHDVTFFDTQFGERAYRLCLFLSPSALALWASVRYPLQPAALNLIMGDSLRNAKLMPYNDSISLVVRHKCKISLDPDL